MILPLLVRIETLNYYIFTLWFFSFPLQVGDTIGVSRNSDATMHVYINQNDLGPVGSNVSEVSNALRDSSTVW